MRIWITWELQRRNRTISSRLNAELHEIVARSSRIVRYASCALKTVTLLLRKRPTLLFAQSPSLVLAALAVAWGQVFGLPVIVDAHNAALIACEEGGLLLRALAIFSVRHAALVLVSNAGLLPVVARCGGRGFVLPDPIPELGTPPPPAAHGDQHRVVYICTFSPDEPVLEVLEAAAALDASTRLFITGAGEAWLARSGVRSPRTVVFTGFLPERDYLQLLHGANAVMVLTRRRDCLLCGAYEAVAAGRPLIVSNTEALRTHFSRGTLYAANEPGDIAVKMREAMAHEEALTSEMLALRRELVEAWERQRLELEELLSRLHRPGRHGGEVSAGALS